MGVSWRHLACLWHPFGVPLPSCGSLASLGPPLASLLPLGRPKQGKARQNKAKQALVRGHGPQHLNGTFGPGVPAEQISRFRKTVNLWIFWIFWIFGIFGIFGRVGIFDDFLTGPRSAKNFRSRIFDDREIAEKSFF